MISSLIQMLNSQILTISLSSINPRELKNRTQHVKERLRPSNQNIVLILYPTFYFPASYLKRKKRLLGCQDQNEEPQSGSDGQGEKNIIHLCPSTPVLCPLSQPYSPETHTYAWTHTYAYTFLYSVCKSRRKIKEGELKQRLWRVQTYSREGRIAGQKDVEDKLGHQQELWRYLLSGNIAIFHKKEQGPLIFSDRNIREEASSETDTLPQRVLTTWKPRPLGSRD